MLNNTSKPLIRQGWLRALVFLPAYFLLATLVYVVCMAVQPKPAQEVGSNAASTRIILPALFITAAATIGLLLVFRRRVDKEKRLIPPVFSWKSFRQNGVIGFCLGIALLSVGTLLLFATEKLDWIDAGFPARDFFIGLVMMALVALSEELVFRGYILHNLLQSLNKWQALGASALIFTVAHGSNPNITVIAIVNLLLSGLLLGINFIYTRNLWFAICFHFSWNFLQGPVLGYPVSGLPLKGILEPNIKGAWWVTGGAFGFEGSFIATGLLIAAIVFLYFKEEKLG
jgi:uncharacterized protein